MSDFLRPSAATPSGFQRPVFAQQPARRLWIGGSILILVAFVAYLVLTTPPAATVLSEDLRAATPPAATAVTLRRAAAASTSPAPPPYRRPVRQFRGYDFEQDAKARAAVSTEKFIAAMRRRRGGAEDGHARSIFDNRPVAAAAQGSNDGGVATPSTILTTSPTSTSTLDGAAPSSSWTPRERIFCVDVNPVEHGSDQNLFGVYRVGVFHACSMERIWVLGSGVGAQQEARSGSMLLLPPPPPEETGAASGGENSSAPFRPFRRSQFAYPITPFNTNFQFTVEDQEESQRFERKMMRGKPQLVAGDEGVALLLAPHYCCRHTMHFLEPLGAMQAALERWLLPPELRADTRPDFRPASPSSANNESSSSSSCNRGKPAARDRNDECFRRIGRVVVFSTAGLHDNSFNFHATKALLFHAHHRAGYSAERAMELALAVPVTPTSSVNVRYDRLVTVGALYDVWPSSEMATSWQESFHAYFEMRKTFGLAATKAPELAAATAATVAKSNKSIVDQVERNLVERRVADEAAKLKQKQRQLEEQAEERLRGVRKIVHLKRTGLRSISNADEFHDFLLETAAMLNRFCDNISNNKSSAIEVLTIKAGGMDVDQLYDALRDARVLIGMHGMDLTNMLLAARGMRTTVIEMNPAFFFEPRFPMLTAKLNVSYRTWNCYSRSCAFSGRPGQFDMQVPERDVVFEEREDGAMLAARGDEQRTRAFWPAIDYLDGRTCVACANYSRLVHATGMSHRFFSAYRGGGVYFSDTKHKREVAWLLLDAAATAGWIARTSDRFTAAEKWIKAAFT